MQVKPLAVLVTEASEPQNTEQGMSNCQVKEGPPDGGLLSFGSNIGFGGDCHQPAVHPPVARGRVRNSAANFDLHQGQPVGFRR